MTSTSNMPTKSELRTAIERLHQVKRRQERQELQEFRRVKDGLKQRVLASFYRDELPSLKLIDEAIRNGRGFPVPALSICGQGTAEIRYTKLLGWYLDSRNAHGLSGLLVESIFDEYFPKDAIPDFATCTVTVELPLGKTKTKKAGETDNYLDILITVGEWKICIEQKILSSEGKDQLLRYKQRLHENYGPEKTLLFYLTPSGGAGSDSDWTPLSHRYLISRMAEVLRSRLLNPVAQHNLRALIWDLMLGPVAQDANWMSHFGREVERVVKKPDANYQRFSRWLSRQSIDAEDRLSLLTVAGG